MEKNAKRLVQALYDEGREVVIVAQDTKFDSAIFYRHKDNIITAQSGWINKPEYMSAAKLDEYYGMCVCEMNPGQCETW